ncbi:MAG: hypothetical protein ABI947_12045 [Chloroflexota bacterium]
MTTRSLAKRCPKCNHPIRVQIWPTVEGKVYPIAFYDARDLSKPEVDRCPGCQLWLYNLEVANALTGLDLRGLALLK